MMGFSSMLSGSPRRPVSAMDEEPDMSYQDSDMPSFLNMGQGQPAPPTYGQAFQAGFQRQRGGLGKKVLGGLSGYSGGGGFMGGIGDVAKFLI